jgi:hypothetical protein
MSDIPALKALLTDALAILEPQINGLTLLTELKLGEQETADIQSALAPRMRRRELITEAIAAFAALEADGFPLQVVSFEISAESLQRITGQVVEIAVGAKVFAVKPPGQITGDLAGADVTEQPAPTEQAP